MLLATKQIIVIVIVATLIFTSIAPSFAQDAPDVGAHGAYGQITALSASSISILPRHVGVTVTYSITPQTTVFVNNKPTTYDKLQVGKIAVVASDDGVTTSNINEYLPGKTNAAGALLGLLVIVGLSLVITDISKPHFSQPSLPVLPPHPL